MPHHMPCMWHVSVGEHDFPGKDGGVQMSILIRGMKMPKRCSECDFCGSYGIGEHICMITAKNVSYDDGLKIRRDDCPLVELPPHGRLVDADALLENVKTVDYIYRKVLRWLIDHASTIIEAEEGEG